MDKEPVPHLTVAKSEVHLSYIYPLTAHTTFKCLVEYNIGELLQDLLY